MTLTLTSSKPTGARPKLPAPDNLPRFVRTPTAEKIAEWLETTRRFGDLGVIRGNPGVGKTSAVAEYAREHARTILVPLMPTTGGKLSVVSALCDRLDIYQARPYQTMRELVARLAPDDEERRALIIFDEAQYMTRDATSQMRGISDQAGVGITFSGNTAVLRSGGSVHGGGVLREADIWRGELAQITSRVGSWHEIKQVDVGDVIAFATACGVPEHDDAALGILAALARKPGALRIAEKVIRHSILNDKSVSADSLKKAALELELNGERRI